jgi:hypothetical protein
MKLEEFFASEPFRARFLARVQNELSQTSLANFALDEAGNLLMEEIALRDQQIAALAQEKADLIAKTTADHQLIAELRERAEAAGDRRRSSPAKG